MKRLGTMVVVGPVCPGCGVLPATTHVVGCPTEVCTICHGPRKDCFCLGHLRKKASWSPEQIQTEPFVPPVKPPPPAPPPKTGKGSGAGSAKGRKVGGIGEHLKRFSKLGPEFSQSVKQILRANPNDLSTVQKRLFIRSARLADEATDRCLTQIKSASAYQAAMIAGIAMKNATELGEAILKSGGGGGDAPSNMPAGATASAAAGAAYGAIRASEDLLRLARSAQPQKEPDPADEARAITEVETGEPPPPSPAPSGEMAEGVVPEGC